MTNVGSPGLNSSMPGGSSSRLFAEQEEALKVYVASALPRSTRQIGAFIEREFGRAGLIALLHRLGLEYHKPEVIDRKLDAEKQQPFIEGYEKLRNALGPDEGVLFLDAVHPTHAARPVGCWAPKEEKLAIEQTSGRQRLNIHGASVDHVVSDYNELHSAEDGQHRPTPICLHVAAILRMVSFEKGTLECAR